MCSIHPTDGDATINRAKGGIGENSFWLFSSSLRSDRCVRAAPNRLPPICRTVGRSPHARSANKKGAPGPLFIGGQGGYALCQAGQRVNLSNHPNNACSRY